MWDEWCDQQQTDWWTDTGIKKSTFEKTSKLRIQIQLQKQQKHDMGVVEPKYSGYLHIYLSVDGIKTCSSFFFKQ